MTIDSPCTEGRHEARRSRAFSPILTLMRPSCGLRFSSIIIPAMILRRWITGPWRRLGAGSMEKHTPSMR